MNAPTPAAQLDPDEVMAAMRARVQEMGEAAVLQRRSPDEVQLVEEVYPVFSEEIASRAGVYAEPEQDDEVAMNDQEQEFAVDELFQEARRRRHSHGYLSWSELDNPNVDPMDHGEANANNARTRGDSIDTLFVEHPEDDGIDIDALIRESLEDGDGDIENNRSRSRAAYPVVVEEGDSDDEDARLYMLGPPSRRRHQARRNMQIQRDHLRDALYSRVSTMSQVSRASRARRERRADARHRRVLEGLTQEMGPDDEEVQPGNNAGAIPGSHIPTGLDLPQGFARDTDPIPWYAPTSPQHARFGTLPDVLFGRSPTPGPGSPLDPRHRSASSAPIAARVYAPALAPAPNAVPARRSDHLTVDEQIQTARSNIMRNYHYVGEFANVETIAHDGWYHTVLQRHPDVLVEVQVRADGYCMIGEHAIFFRFRR
ncbi:uncharacterized protein N0V89_001988 [Didymosphaeria variabile]|uniref:Uncharacterized protein n=1 Tax=Didymosphaeria variabile TaxID=1932322 RepID=A0A9W9CE92_9PLEO|nr:uncharacterized protein N0V89_001988 [Didymosphaeria variabile]KAJ4357413.1 hypothetical protein N0V89_001988 [Didymosphaeria variabile]